MSRYLPPHALLSTDIVKGVRLCVRRSHPRGGCKTVVEKAGCDRCSRQSDERTAGFGLATGDDAHRGFGHGRIQDAYHCQGIAEEDEFKEQAERAAGVIMWYQQIVRVLPRLSGGTPVAVSGFCGAGGTDEGIRRCGGASVGFDAVHQPHFVARFGVLRGSHFGLHGEGGSRPTFQCTILDDALRRGDGLRAALVWGAGAGG